MKIVSIALFLSIWVFTANAQDTIRIMSYNLMNYNYDTDYCHNYGNNDPDLKNDYISTIIGHTLPDIVGFVEVSKSEQTKYLLKGALNSDGRDYYKETNFNTESGLSGIVYYNENKVTPTGEVIVNVNTVGLRNLRIYSFKHKNISPDIYVHIVLGHLEPGSSNLDETGRAQQIATLYDILEQQGHNDNYILMGDLNVYEEDEAMFGDVLRHNNSELKFYDPVGLMDGDNDYIDFGDFQYRAYQTQSTSADDNPNGSGCFATGGLDDRFDMILVDDDIMSGDENILYIENSYKTLGQDGYHWNEYLTEGGNTSAPSEVINALQLNSDHLPVYADFIFGEPAGISNLSANLLKIKCQNPAHEILSLHIQIPCPKNVEICIYNVLGSKLIKYDYNIEGNDDIQIPIEKLQNGMYILTAQTNDGTASLRFIKE